MFILKKKKKDKLNFSIAFVKNFENLKTIIKSIKKQKIDEVFL
ncbi:hypothetical protein H17ap60334_05122 [Thermosipho africanus H17ap60334]|nr:hypothetical protein [Thermosipho africanus]EKF49566.1 hypothetical protein H17ap60334_05122 [Thermosipho africanus H17ap60334]